MLYLLTPLPWNKNQYKDGKHDHLYIFHLYFLTLFLKHHKPSHRPLMHPTDLSLVKTLAATAPCLSHMDGGLGETRCKILPRSCALSLSLTSLPPNQPPISVPALSTSAPQPYLTVWPTLGPKPFSSCPLLPVAKMAWTRRRSARYPL
jgi:hypothetical protein